MKSKQEKILLVDDEEPITEAVELYLRGEGFKVISADDVSAAVDKFRSLKPDLVVIDSAIAGKLSPELLGKFREAYQVPVIMITPHESATGIAEGAELGADEIITKPFRPRDLAARVKTVLRRSQLVQYRTEMGGCQ